MKYFDRILKYHEKRMSEAEVLAFEADLGRDEILQKENEAFKTVLLVTQSLAYEHLKNDNPFTKDTYVYDEDPQPKKFGLIKVLSGLLIILGIVFIEMAINLLPYKTDNLLKRFDPLTVPFRNTTGIEVPEHIARSFDKFNDRQFDKAIYHLNKDSIPAFFEREYKYMLAYSYMYVGKEQDCRNMIQLIRSTERMSDNFNMDWLEVLLAMRTGQFEDLKALLIRLSRQEFHPYQYESVRLLNKVESLYFGWAN